MSGGGGESTIVPFPERPVDENASLRELIRGLDVDMLTLHVEVAHLSWNGVAPNWPNLNAAMAALQERLALIRDRMTDGAA